MFIIQQAWLDLRCRGFIFEEDAEKNRAGPRKKDKHLSYDESVDEDAKLIDAEPVEVEAEVPAEENEPIEGTTQNDKPPPPAFEE